MKKILFAGLLAGGLLLGSVATAQEALDERGVVVSPGSEAARPPQIDWAAEKLKASARVDDLEKKYLALSSYHTQSRKVRTMQRTREEEATTIWMERTENNLRWRMEMEIVRQLEDTAPTTIRTVNVSLGEESWTDTEAKGQRRVMRSQPNQWNSHFDVMRRNMSAHVNMVMLEGEETVLDHACTVLKVMRGAETRRTIQRYWICNETGLLMRETEEKEGRLDASTYEIEKIEWNEPIAESVWEYTPPADVKVMDLLEKKDGPAAPGSPGTAPDAEPASAAPPM
jgi:outer membrane lipoprotein-sorting protein